MFKPIAYWQEVVENTTITIQNLFNGGGKTSRYVRDNSTTGEDRVPQPGRAYIFDGVDDYVECPTGPELVFNDGTNDLPFSVSFWVKSNGFNIGDIIAKTNATASLRDWRIIADGGGADNSFLFVLYSGNVSNRIQLELDSADHGLDDGNWHHVFVSYDGSGVFNGLNIRIDAAIPNNVQRAMVGSYTGMPNGSTTPLYLGRVTTLRQDMELFDVRIYNRLLTEQEITDISNNRNVKEIDTVRNGLVRHYPCDDNHSDFCWDASGNEQHGTKFGITSDLFNLQDKQVPYSLLNMDGFTESIHITKTGTNTVFDAEVKFRNRLLFTNNGGVCTVVNNINEDYFIGFSSSNTLNNSGSIEYAIRKRSNGGNQYAVFENGVELFVSGSTPTPLDKIEVRKTGTTIEYIINEVVIFTSSVAVTADMEIDMSIFSGNVSDIVFIKDGKSELLDPITEDAAEVSRKTYFPIDQSDNTKDILNFTPMFIGRGPRNGAFINSNSITFSIASRVNYGIQPSFEIGTDDFTISTRLYINQVDTLNRRILATGAFSNTSAGYALSTNGSTLRVFVSDGTSRILTVGQPINQQQWYDVNIVFDSGTLRVFIDNIEVETISYASLGSITNSQELSIGFGHFTNTHFNGRQCGVRMDRKALSQNERIFVNTIGKSGTNPGSPEFYSPMSEGNGLDVYDVSGNGNHGVIINSNGNEWINTQDVFHWSICKGYTQVGTVKVPALEDGSADAQGNALTNPSGEFHNEAETKIDWTDGVETPFKREYDPPTNYNYGEAITPPRFKDSVNGKESNYRIEC